MRKLFRSYLSGFFLCCAVLAAPSAVHAAISLSVSPSEGGSSLHIGRIDPQTAQSKEVRLRVNSSEGKQYQVFQRVVNPLVNDQGTNFPMAALKTYTLIGSNAYGTLYSQDISSIGYSEQLLYTSNPNGDSDSLTVIYSFDGKEVNASGNFLGQIMYTVRAIGGGGQADSFLNVTVEAAPDFEFGLEASSGHDLLKLDSLHPTDIPVFVKVSFAGNSGSEVRVYQEMDEFLQDELSEVLGQKAILVSVEGGQGQTLFTQPLALERKRVLLYTSRGSEDSFMAHYALDPAGTLGQKAAVYRGKLDFVAEVDGREQRQSVDLQVEVKPVFKLEVEYPPEGVRFESLLPDSPPQIKELKVKVITNLGRPYAITQTVNDRLTNEKGVVLPAEYFTIKEALLGNSSGKLIFSDFSPVSIGDSPIFYSDAKGSSVELKVFYRLSPYPSIEAGNYTAGIVFSLQEM